VQGPNPFQGLLPGTAFNGGTIPRQQLLRPFPQFDDITEDRRPIGTTDYDSLQVSVNKRLTHGLQFLVSYALSKRMEEVSYLNPQDDWSGLERRVTDDDAPQPLFVSATYQLPSISGGRGALGLLLGGWQANGIVVFQWSSSGPEWRFGSGWRSADRQSDVRSLVPNVHRDAVGRAAELRERRRAGRLAGGGALYAAVVTDAPRERSHEAAGAAGLLVVQDLRAAIAFAAAGPAGVVQPVQHTLVRRAEHERERGAFGAGDADAGQRSAKHPARRPADVLVLVLVASARISTRSSRQTIDCRRRRQARDLRERYPERWRHDCALSFEAPVGNRRGRQGRDRRHAESAEWRSGADRKTLTETQPAKTNLVAQIFTSSNPLISWLRSGASLQQAMFAAARLALVA